MCERNMLGKLTKPGSPYSEILESQAVSQSRLCNSFVKESVPTRALQEGRPRSGHADWEKVGVWRNSVL